MRNPLHLYAYGYIIGFLASAYFIGKSVKPLYPRKAIILGIPVQVIIYAYGVIWLTAWYIIPMGMNPVRALVASITAGVAPFIAWDTFKAMIAVFLVYATRIAYRKIIKRETLT